LTIPTAQTEAPSTALRYTPALDGVRAIAVLAVLAFHGGVPGFGGGFLGVSTFFTLSGFLITTLLLVHVHRPPQPARPLLGDFWKRRARRLMPAALVGIALATVVTLAVGSGDAQQALPGDVVASLAEVANWRFLVSGASYGALFTEPSALLPYWSLAIEEQFYLLVPLLVVGALRWKEPATRLRVLAIGTVVLLLASVGSSLLHLGDPDRLYYGSDTRAAELLVGCLLAIVIFWRGGPGAVTRTPRRRTTFAVLGVLALVGSAAAWVAVERGDAWLQPGGLLVYASLSALVVCGALVPGPQSTVLAIPALVWIGARSYGIYVLHWPLFLLLDESRTGLDGAPLFLLRIAITFGVAAVLFVVIEQPIRHKRRVRWLPRQPAYLGPALVALILVAVFVVPPREAPTNIDFAATQQQFEEELARAGSDGSVPPGVDPSAAPAPWLVFVGDRLATATSYGMLPLLERRPEAHYGGITATATCSLLRGTAFRDESGVQANPEQCEARDETWRDAADAAATDVVFVQVGLADVLDHALQGRWTGLGDAELDARLATELQDLIDSLRHENRVVAIATLPTDWTVLGRDKPASLDEATYRARAERFNQLVTEAVAAREGDAVVVDVARWHDEHGGGARFRPDGVQTDGEQVLALTNFILDDVLAAHRTAWVERPEVAATDGSALRVLVVGDSTALPFAVALNGRSRDTGDVEIASLARSNCGLVRGGTSRTKSREEEVADRCPDWRPSFTEAVDTFRPDVVLIVEAMWELDDRRLPGDDEWRAVGDPVFDAHLKDEITEAVDVLSADGAVVAVVRYPRLDLTQFEEKDPNRVAMDEATRMARFNELLDEVVASRPGVAVTLDLAGHATSFPGGELDAERRPDGVHFTERAAREVVDSWLMDQLRQADSVTSPS
jgi:peptidoglycan/LPS O-acetylase OafA/YrhL